MLSRVVAALVLAAVPASAAAQQADLPEDRSFASELTAVSGAVKVAPDLLVILDRREVSFPSVAGTFTLFKALDARTGQSWRIALDSALVPVPYDDLLGRERTLQVQERGSLSSALHELLQRTDERTIPVLIKVRVPEEVVDKSRLPRGRELDAVVRQAQSLDRQMEQEASRLFRQALREQRLGVPEEIAQSGPFIRTRLSGAALRRLARDRRVAFIGLDGEREVPDYPTISQSLPTTRTDMVHSFGARGAGVKIAVLESGTLTDSASCFNIGATQNTGAAPNSHMTKSAAIIGNRYNNGACNGSWQGYAPDATVLLANEADYEDRYDWAKAQGVNVITMSWHYGSEETNGGLHARDVYFDHAVTHYPWPTVFTSAGNQAGDSAYASGKGYNFFGVGNVLNDGDGDRCNDVMAVSSSWIDPTSPHGDREVPEIASPGSRHALLGTSFGGTSAATPVTASIAAVLMSANASLRIWPEAIRPILLATANYQDADGAGWSKYSDGKDGAGMTNTLYGYYTARRRETTDAPQFRAHDYGTMTSGSFSGGFFNRQWKAYTATTSSRIRVAITWNSKTTSSSSILDADLDLWVYDPDMNLVAWSTTWDSNYEFVEFAPTKTGAYTIKIRGYSVPSDFWSYYGVAWTTHYDLCP